jgi:hypothetical protein
VKNINKVSFARDVRPLFRSVDIEHMKGRINMRMLNASTIPSLVRRSRESRTLSFESGVFTGETNQLNVCR